MRFHFLEALDPRPEGRNYYFAVSSAFETSLSKTCCFCETHVSCCLSSRRLFITGLYSMHWRLWLLTRTWLLHLGSCYYTQWLTSCQLSSVTSWPLTDVFSTLHKPWLLTGLSHLHCLSVHLPLTFQLIVSSCFLFPNTLTTLTTSSQSLLAASATGFPSFSWKGFLSPPQPSNISQVSLTENPSNFPHSTNHNVKWLYIFHFFLSASIAPQYKCRNLIFLLLYST